MKSREVKHYLTDVWIQARNWGPIAKKALYNSEETQRTLEGGQWTAQGLVPEAHPRLVHLQYGWGSLSVAEIFFLCINTYLLVSVYETKLFFMWNRFHDLSKMQRQRSSVAAGLLSPLPHLFLCQTFPKCLFANGWFLDLVAAHSVGSKPGWCCSHRHQPFSFLMWGCDLPWSFHLLPFSVSSVLYLFPLVLLPCSQCSQGNF